MSNIKSTANIQSLITYRHDITIHTQCYILSIVANTFLILSLNFPHLCVLNVWTNIDLISCLFSDFIPKRQVP